MVALANPPDIRVVPFRFRTWRAIPVHPALAITWCAAGAWAVGFGYLAVVRHLAGGTHAEDLGFTDQVLWNFLHGQWFRMSIYNGATWNTELDISRLARPDSLLAFHFEPLLLALVPVYAVIANPVVLLVLQSVAVAAGAVPAYRIAKHLTGSEFGSAAVAAAYLLSPFGQSAVLADFHSSTLAAPLLLLAVDRLLVARAPVQAVVAAALAACAREDAAATVAVLGLGLIPAGQTRKAGLAITGIGAAISILALLVVRTYSGGISPFEIRYGPTLANPLGALARPLVLEYARTLLLSGGWLAVLAPLTLLPALPSLALNALSTSPWMASGAAHYSGLVLPFVSLGAAAGLSRFNGHRRVQLAASVGLLVISLGAYRQAGSGPFAANYAPASVTSHAQLAADMAAAIPQAAAVSASTSLVPHLSERSRVYVFPTVLDADYVLLDLRATPAPTSARDVYLRVQNLLADGWGIARDDDGVVLLAHDAPAPSPPPATVQGRGASPALLSATLVPSPDGAIDVDGPRWVLRTTWQIEQPLAGGTRPDFWISLKDGQQVERWDLADVWWNPPDQWPVKEPITIDIPDIPVRTFDSWAVTWTGE